MFQSTTKVRVRYAETDQMGYCYYGNYAQYYEVARVEALRSLGISYKNLEAQGYLLPVSDFSIKYVLPAFYDEENIFELAIESGADECISHDEFHEVQCIMSEIYNVKKKLEKIISNFISTEIEWVPLNSVDVNKEREEPVINFLETLEDDDDVQNVYSNVNFGNN